MHTITIDGTPTGNTYFGLDHALPVARRIATMRARKGQTVRVCVVDTHTGEETEVA